ncbi:MAG: hypothetical protein QMB24_16610 [Spirosomataceae bacterium]|mgnify:CR=1 FL=1|jgi:uncharacterized protein YlbG (UPF0298 family)
MKPKPIRLLQVRLFGEVTKNSFGKSYILQYPNIDDGTFIWTQYPDLRYVFAVNILPNKEIDEQAVTQHLSKYTYELIYQASAR